MNKTDHAAAMREILREDSRFAPEAYRFVQEALHFTMRALPERRHVSGAELLEGIRKFALQEFGPMAKTVLNSWGVAKCEDFGAIVFNMVNKAILRKRDEDSIEDFAGGYDFDTAFRKPFEAGRRSGTRTRTVKDKPN